tara:strand:- start:151833 stop:152057 length:225 start_codon:yes stop_codon:yes gene_type:complete
MSILRFFLNALKRALTKDGGGVIKLRNESNELDLVAVGAAVIRVLIGALVVILAAKLGVTDQQLIEVIQQLFNQ